MIKRRKQFTANLANDIYYLLHISRVRLKHTLHTLTYEKVREIHTQRKVEHEDDKNERGRRDHPSVPRLSTHMDIGVSYNEDFHRVTKWHSFLHKRQSN